MQRIFDTKQASIFNGKSTNEQSISDLALMFQNNSNPASNDISTLLFMVQTFLAATAPKYQLNRDKLITDNKIVAILEKAGKSLQDFRDKYKNPRNEEAMNAFDYCERALLDQLEILHKNNDKIYLYYASHDNSLKMILSTYKKMSNKF